MAQRGSYNCRWRKQERRESAVARQKALCVANANDRTAGLVKRLRGNDIEVKKPMDWHFLLPQSQRQQEEEIEVDDSRPTDS